MGIGLLFDWCLSLVCPSSSDPSTTLRTSGGRGFALVLHLSSLFFYFSLTILLAARTADARVTKIVIDKVESPAFDGQEFGAVGKYEKLIGRVFGEVDPNAPENVEIVNLDRAPKTANGHVAYSADLYMLKPI